MADESWKVNMAVINSRSKFSFFNKVRVLLKKILKPDERIDDVVDEHFRFTSSLSLDAPDGQIDELYQDGKDGKYHLTLFDNGLTGAAGVLPAAYTEWLIERKLRYNDNAPKAFMDMFDHRMYCLSYLAWQKMHLSGDENRRDNNVLNNVLLSLVLEYGFLCWRAQSAHAFSRHRSGVFVDGFPDAGVRVSSVRMQIDRPDYTRSDFLPVECASG